MKGSQLLHGVERFFLLIARDIMNWPMKQSVQTKEPMRFQYSFQKCQLLLNFTQVLTINIVTDDNLSLRIPERFYDTSITAWIQLSTCHSKANFTMLRISMIPRHVIQLSMLYLVNSVQHILPSPMPLTVRISILNLQFMKLSSSKHKQQVIELQKYYFITSSEIETARYSALNSSSTNQLLQCSVNAHYDQQHSDLISRTEYSLNLIEQRLIQPKQPKTTESSAPHENSSKPTANNTIAHRIMNNWYERNKEHPYPSYETAEVIAKAGGITVEQVKKWFANKRLRLGNTKHITEIAKRRKKSPHCFTGWHSLHRSQHIRMKNFKCYLYDWCYLCWIKY